MRSFPSCWNKTLTQLGFTRKRRKAKNNRERYNRRSLFESLEARQMLAADYIVTTEVDEEVASGGSIVGDDNLWSLREAIQAANDTDGMQTIEIPSTIGNRIDLSLGRLEITSELTITGPGADQLTIDAGGNSRVFSIDDGDDNSALDVSISGLKITRGNTPGVGGGILNKENLTLSEVTVYNNHAGNDGGGIFVSGAGSLTLLSSTVDLNTSGDKGAGIYGVFSDNPLIIDSSTISNNETDSAWGGGLVYRNTTDVDGASGTITNSTFSGNKASSFAGIRIDGSDIGNATDVEITNTTITDNEAVGAGGGLAVYDQANVTLHNTILAGNFAGTATKEDYTGSETLDSNSSYNLFGFAAPAYPELDSPLLKNLFGYSNPMLTSLGNYDGPTFTHAPLEGSPVIDAGDNNQAGTIDQRGLEAIVDGGVTGLKRDIGAHEFGLQVSTLDDINDGDYSPGNLSLREALSLAAQLPGRDRITFDASLTGRTILLDHGAQLDVDSNVDIVGLGASSLTIQADTDAGLGRYSRVMEITNGVTTEISGVTISGGLLAGASEGGGGIYSEGDLTLTDVIVIDNESEQFVGGGVFNSGGNLTIQGGTFSNNESGNAGGAIYSSGGSVTITEYGGQGTLIVENTSYAGGGIMGSSSDISITGATIGGAGNLKNVATGSHGGGIRFDATANQTLEITDTDILGNEAQRGGGIYILDETASDNGTAPLQLIVSGSTAIADNKASLSGGGIYVKAEQSYHDVDVDISSGTISGNESQIDGGGIWFDQGVEADLIEVLVSGNESSALGGGVFSEGAAVSIQGGTFSDNESGDSGGAIYSIGGSLTVLEDGLQGTSIVENRSGAGAGIFVKDGDASITGATIGGLDTLKNVASNSKGGGIRFQSSFGNTLSIFDTVITGNQARGGGGLYILDTDSNALISPTVSISSSQLTNNTSIDPSTTAIFSGGGIANEGGELTIYGGEVSGNSAGDIGGGIYFRSDEENTLTIIDVDILDNSANQGGGVYVNNLSTTPGSTTTELVVSGSTTILQNSATVNGGGILVGDSNVTITGATIGALEDLGNSAGSNQGGGIYFQSSSDNSLSIFDSHIIGNSAQNGAGIYLYDNDLNNALSPIANITGSVISDNTTTGKGGGIYNNDGGTVTIYGSEISRNSASSHGGGILSRATFGTNGGIVTIYGGEIIDNESTGGSGGGINVEDGGVVKVYGTEISGNTAVTTGGGINSLGGSTVTIDWGKVSGNETSSYGGGVHSEGGTINVIGGEISGNKSTNSDGGGLSIHSGGTATFYGGVISGNDAADEGGGIMAHTASLTIEEYNGVGTVITSNTARNGGGIKTRDTDVSISGATVGGLGTLGNVASGSFSQDGGGINFYSALGNKLKIIDTDVLGNHAQRRGGGIHVRDNSSAESPPPQPLEVTISGGSRIADNTTGTGGGAIYAYAAESHHNINTNILDTAIENNIATNSGGGILLFGQVNGTITDSEVQNNQAGVFGGGLYSYLSDVTLENAKIERNEALGERGGGIYSDGGSIEIQSSSIIGNTSFRGGGISKLMRAGESLKIIDSSITHNVAEHNSAVSTGGGLFIYGEDGTHVGEFELINSTVAHNESRSNATGSGGSLAGMFLWNLDTATIHNSTISSNIAENSQAGIGVSSSNIVRVINSTITANQSLGDLYGAFHESGSNTVIAHNTIIAGNTSAGSNGDIDVSILDSSSSHNLFGQNVGDITGLGSGNNKLQPGQELGLSKLANYGGPTETHVPLPGSPAIDAGDNAQALDWTENPPIALVKDQRGFGRVIQPSAIFIPNIDIGSTEAQGLVATGDFNGDGHDDHAYVYSTGNFLPGIPVNNSVRVVLGSDGTPVSGVWATLDSTDLLKDFLAGDFNGDGRDDLIFRDSGTNDWTLAVSDSTRFNLVDLGLSTSWSSEDLLVGDFDGDGSDELIGRLAADNAWEMLQFDDGLSAMVETTWGGSLTSDPAAFDPFTIFVDDVNGDGRDDLIGKKSHTVWWVSLSQESTNSFTLGLNWGDWFDDHLDSEGTPIADAPYQQVIEIFSDVYNNVELELYPGLMKGPQATADTLAGNPWDQAAYLVQRFETSGFEANIVTGQIDATTGDLQKWLGLAGDIATQEATIQNAALNIIKTSMDANAVETATGVQFTHAWVQVKAPTATDLDWIDVDPSWKFRQLRDGIDISGMADQLGTFDELDYLSLPEDNQQLALEFFEDQLMEYLASQGLGQSLAEVSSVGPIIQQQFDTLPESWSSATAQSLGNFAAIKDDEQYVHKVTLSAERITSLTPISMDVVLSPGSLASYNNLDQDDDPQSDPFTFVPPSASSFDSYNPGSSYFPYDYDPLPAQPDTTFNSNGDFDFYTGFEFPATVLTTTQIPINSGTTLTPYGYDGSTPTQIDFAGATLQPVLPEQYPNYTEIDFGGLSMGSYDTLNDANLNDGDVVQLTSDALTGDQTLSLTTSASDPVIAMTVDLLSNYEITANTRLSLKVQWPDRGLMHAIGWSDSGSSPPSLTDARRFFRFTGSPHDATVWSHINTDTTYISGSAPNSTRTHLGDDLYHYEIELGHSAHGYSGSEVISHLIFLTEGDPDGDPNAQTEFSEIALYEVLPGSDGSLTLGSGATEFSFSTQTTPYGRDYKSLDIGSYQVTSNTVLEFDVSGATGSEGVRAIGVATGTGPHFDAIYTHDISSGSGTQTWNIGNDLGILDGYFLPVTHLVFINTGAYQQGPIQYTTSTYSDISFYEDPLGSANVSGDEIHLKGTASRSIDIADHVITEDTILRFRYRIWASAAYEGAVHSIGWDDNNLPDDSAGEGIYHFYGDLVTEGRLYDGVGEKEITIPIGSAFPQFIGESISNLVFNSEEGGSAIFTAESRYSDIRIEDVEEFTYTGTKSVSSANDGTITLTGTTAETLVVPGDYKITPYTTLRFDFSSNSQGQIHRVGWDTNASYSSSQDDARMYPIHGTSTSTTTTSYPAFYGGYTSGTQTIDIPIGQIAYSGQPTPIGQDISRLVFTVEGYDVNSNAQSVFSNVQLFDDRPSGDFQVVGFDEIRLFGNSSKSIAGSGIVGTHKIQEDMWLVFDFSSTQEGNLHAIGWEFANNVSGENLSDEKLYPVYGTNASSGGLYDLYDPVNPQPIAIPIGQIQVNGESPVGRRLNRLVFHMDGGSAGISADSVFSNVRLVRPVNSAIVSGSGSNATIELTGNTAKRHLIDPYDVTPNTMLSFTFDSDHEGWPHGIGIDDDGSLHPNAEDTTEALFQLHGSVPNYRFYQTENNQFFGSETNYTIPIGQYYQGNANQLVFFNQPDFLNEVPGASDEANSIFKNIQLYEEIGTLGSQWSHTLSVPEYSLDDIQLDMIKTSSSPNRYRTGLRLDGSLVKAGPHDSIIPGDIARITVEHTVPSLFGIGETRTNFYDQEYNEVLTLGLDANQYSRDNLTEKQAQLLTSLESNNGEDDFVDDIDELLSYTVAKYWHDFNRDNAAIGNLTDTIGFQAYVGSGIAKANSVLLRDSADTTDYTIDHLPYLIAPYNMGVDLPNANHVFSSRTTGIGDLEAFQLGGYNASGLEHDAVEQQINSESVSTMKGLRNAYQRDLGVDAEHAPISDDSILVFERTLAGTILYQGQWYSGSGQPAENQALTQLSELEALLVNHVPQGGGSNTIAASVWTHLSTAPQVGGVSVMIPKGKCKVGDWVGSVYLMETFDTGLYAIVKEGGSLANGGFSGNVYDPVNLALPETTFKYQTFSGDPVSVANGNMFRDEVDIVFPNLGVPLNFTRHYDSNSDDDIGMAVGWVYSFGDVLIDDSENPGDLIWITSSGQRHTFEANGAGYDVPSALHGTFEEIGGVFYYKDKNGMEYHFEKKTITENGFDVAGRLSKQVDNIGNGVDVIYKNSTSREIDYVADVHTTNRKLVFTYANDRIATVTKHFEGSDVDTWTYHYQSVSGADTVSDQRLIRVLAPAVDAVDNEGLTTTETPTVSYSYYQSGFSVGLIEKITETSGDFHTYEYYPNGRTFRVNDSAGGVESYNYNLFRNLTEFTDMSGNTEIYIHQDNGLLNKQIHDDRTRTEFTWGEEGSDLEYLMTSSADEVGAVEEFTYYTSNSDDFRYRELQQATSKHFQDAAGNPIDVDAYYTTDFDYFQPATNSQMILLDETVVDPGGEDITTSITYDGLGRLLDTTDAEGNVTKRAYNLEDATSSGGLLKSETGPRGNDTSPNTLPNKEYVLWDELASSFTVTGDTLSVRVTVPVGAESAGQHVNVDAVRIERVDGDFPYSRVIDEDNDLLVDEFYTTGSAGYHDDGDGYQVYVNGDRILLTLDGSTATWIFDSLQPGNYRVLTTWHPLSSRSDAVPYEIFDGAPGAASSFSPPAVDQTVAPANDGPLFITTFSYDASGNVTHATTDGRPTAQNTYDHNGNLLTSLSPADASGQKVQSEFVYDVLGRQLQSNIYPEGEPADALTTTYQYDIGGRLRYSTDELGRTTEFIYDLRGNLIEQVGADDTSVTFRYDAMNQVVSQTDQLGRTTETVYDNRNRPIQTIHPDGVSEQIRYTGIGQLFSTVDARGLETTFRYDAAGRLVETTNAAGNTASNNYDNLGRLTSSADYKGNLTKFKYDDLGRVIETRVLPTLSTELLLALSTVDYDAAGNEIRHAIYDTVAWNWRDDTAPAEPRDEITALNIASNLVQMVETSYDSLNRPVEVSDAGGTTLEQTTRTVYDPAGRVVYQYDELGRRSELRYDEYGRLAETIAPDPDGDGTLYTSPITQYEYDDAGNQTAIIDPNGNRTEFKYDVFNRVVTTTDALLGQSHVVYDVAGQMVAAIDALGRAAYSLYDNRGRVVKSVSADPDGSGELLPSETQFEYDAVGNLTSQIDARGFETTFQYDVLNRLFIESFSEELIIDDGDSGFAINRSDDQPPTEFSIGHFGDSQLVGHDADASSASHRNVITTWTFQDVAPGTYQVLATWDPQTGSNATDELEALFRNSSGSMQLFAGFLGDQDVAPNDVITTTAGVSTAWAVVGEIDIDASNSEVEIWLRSDRYEDLLADAVMLRKNYSRSYLYDNNGNLRFEIDTLARVTQYTYDELNRVKTVELPDPDGGDSLTSPKTTTYYDGFGNVTSAVEFRHGQDRTTEWTYDHRNRVLTETLDATGHNTVITQFQYDAVGNLVRQVDDLWGINAVTDFFYDDLNRLTKEQQFRSDTDVHGLSTFYQYDASSNLTQSREEVTDGTSTYVSATDFTYDTLNRQTRMLVAGVMQSETEYDAVGNVLATTDGLYRTTTYEYDDLNRLTTTTTPDPDGSGGLLTASVSRTAYDAVGNVVSQINGEQEEETFAYDRFGRMITSTDALQHSTHYSYDTEGNRLTYEDPNGNVTSYQYDALNRLTAETITLNGTEESRTYAYNDQGNLASIVDRNGRTIEFTQYDRLDRLQGQDWKNSVGTLKYQAGWNYDKLGRLTLSNQIDFIQGTNSLESFEYDHLGRVTARYNYDPNGTFGSTAPRVAQRYDYDNATFVSTPGSTAGYQISTDYSQYSVDALDNETLIAATTITTDALGRVTTIGDDSSAVGGLADKLVTYSYDYANQMTRVERGANGGSLDFDTRYAYDGMGRVSEIAHSGAIGSQLAAFNSYAYQYDKAHRIIEQITTRDEAISALSAISAVDTETFTFDDAGQLTDVTATGSDDETYEYDENGNRKEDGVISIGDHNRLDADADWTYTYDREGNLTRRDAQIGSDYTTYEWDNQNRLEKLVSVVGGSTQTIEYRYNAAGQLSSRTTGGQTEHYIYNGSQRVLALDDAGNVLHRYTWGPGVDQLLVDEVFNGTGQVEETLWAANDHLGSVTQLLDDTGTVVEHREYDSFGAIDQVFDETGTEVGSANLRSEVAHTGSFWDDDAALYQKRARWYDAESGRFIGEDPATDGSNWYVYAGNDPINFIDPTGLAQAGNPLNSLAGGYSGNNVQEEKIALRTIGNIATNAFTSTVRNLNPITSSVVNAGIGLGIHALSSPVKLTPGKEFQTGRVSNSGNIYILNEPITNASGKPQKLVPIAGGSVDLSSFSTQGEVEMAVTGDNEFDKRYAKRLLKAKYGQIPKIGDKFGQLIHHGPQTGTVVTDGVKLPLARMQVVPSEVNQIIRHEGTASVGRHSISQQNITVSSAKAAAKQYNLSLASKFKTQSSAGAMAALNVYLVGRDVLQEGGALSKNYTIQQRESYVFQEKNTLYPYPFTVQPGPDSQSPGVKTYVGGYVKGLQETLSPAEVRTYQTQVEKKFGRYVPGNIFRDPRFEPGTHRQSIEIVDDRGFSTGYIDGKGVHSYSEVEAIRYTIQ